MLSSFFYSNEFIKYFVLSSIGRFRVISMLGKGGQGIALKVEDPDCDE